MEAIRPSQLRQNLYRILDRVLETGEPVEIIRRGRRMRIIVDTPSRLEVLEPHPDYVVGDAEALVEWDWSEEWQP